MSRYPRFRATERTSQDLESRPSKVSHRDLAAPLQQDSFTAFVDSLPSLLAARELRELVQAIGEARNRRKAVIWGFGGHVIKVGLTPILNDLMREGFVTALATNGSGLIHDFEMAWAGKTSEDVEAQLQEGLFGMARETGQNLNRIIREGARAEKGIGEAVGEFLLASELAYPALSIFRQAYELGIPCTVHLAIGTDILQLHPEASGEALGKGSSIDFEILASQVAALHEGGVYLNIGSAVLLPEVFLKAVALVRSVRALQNFTTANLDFIQHYRPLQNVVNRPVAVAGGRGIALTGHHEIMIPLLAGMLKQWLD